METEAIGPVKPGRAANRKVSGYVSATLKMWRFKRQYEQCLEDVRRRRLAMNGGELARADRLLSLSEHAPANLPAVTNCSRSSNITRDAASAPQQGMAASRAGEHASL
jgi:hypothetical protein